MRTTGKHGQIVLLVVVSVFMLGSFGCAAPKYVHMVFFTMKPDTPQAQIDALVDDCCTMLPKVPSVRKIESGRRDVKADRPVNDTEFDVGLIVYFDNKEGYDAYEVHPTHKELVGKHKANFKSVRVCDFIAK